MRFSLRKIWEIKFRLFTRCLDSVEECKFVCSFVLAKLIAVGSLEMIDWKQIKWNRNKAKKYLKNEDLTIWIEMGLNVLVFLTIKFNLNLGKVTASHPKSECSQFKLHCGLGQALEPTLSTRHSVTFGLFIVKWSDKQQVNVAAPLTVV